LISGAFSGLIAAGIVDGMDGVKGLLAWRWLFILEGSITVVIALCGYFVLPNFPRTTKWLSEEEIQLAVWRLEEDVGEDDWIDSKQQSLWHGLALALTDIKTYTFVGTSFLKFQPYCTSLFSNRSSC
jgi:MFS family permease